MTNDPRPTDPFRPATSDPFDRPPTAPQLGAVTPVAPVAPVTGPAVRSRSRGSGLFLNALLGIAVVVAIGGVAFAVGRATAPVSAAAAGNGNGRFGNGGFVGGPKASGAPGGPAGGIGNAGASIEGTVTAISADSITLQLASGQSVTIPIDAQTTYHQRTAATAADVTNGSTVIVQLQGGRGFFTGNGGGNGGNGGAAASGQPTRTLPAATSITLAPTGS